MHIVRIGWGIRGFQRLAGYATRYIRMVSEEAKRRARVLALWEKHGLEATITSSPAPLRYARGFQRGMRTPVRGSK